MPPRLSRNHGGRSRAGVKIKLIRRPKENPFPSPPWTELPRDVTANILHRLGAVEILETAQKVCTTWRSVCKEPAMWRVIDMQNDGDLSAMPNFFRGRAMPYDLKKMCRHAVDRSQGQLVDINLEHFGSDELLDYIADRSGKLERLRLACCDDLSGEGLIKALKRFPQLEELHIIRFFISSETVELVGQSCPLLRSFAFNYQACYDIPDDEDAKAISKSMPELRHLQLLKNGLTNEGVKAILDGCSHLETLDLRRSCHVKLMGDIAKRCSTEIKCLRYPDESTSDFDSDSESIHGFHFVHEYFDEDFDEYTNMKFMNNEDYLFDGDHYPFLFF